MRKGPGTDWSKKKRMDFKDTFVAYCYGYSVHDKKWYYGKTPSGTKGWVYATWTSKGRGY
ncbi:hypothetical protein HCC61_04075 [Streptomyces sp. HNM0575]|uniref:hypothetical protein n=1 Tax=Streptomyces sp. HNM0575 TaxID=2716338 RepID=UPI00145E37CB|nr:hypothetical protein [Streptomyces sp. HNM0575]NLU71868.1 hypothetical protein [Streptomyces sp. HNM0575]